MECGKTDNVVFCNFLIFFPISYINLFFREKLLGKGDYFCKIIKVFIIFQILK